MVPAVSLRDIQASLASQVFGDHGRGEPPKPGVRLAMAGILFAPPDATLAQREILPRLEYFHQRAGKHIDFFCAGYTQGWEGGKDVNGCSDYKNAGLDGWVFSNERFLSLCKEVSAVAKWNYSGETDLILLNAEYDPHGRSSRLDFSSTIQCRLDAMKEHKAIASVPEFFEKVFRYAESANPNDPTWGFSDREGMEQVGSAIVRLVLGLLPKNVSESYRKTKHFAVVDISRSNSRFP
jgi:hypothetical protein